MYSIEFTSQFRRKFKKLHKSAQLAFIEIEDLLKENPFDPRLKTHKLLGHLRRYWAFSVSPSIRVLFTFKGEKIIILYTIGDHGVYHKFLR